MKTEIRPLQTRSCNTMSYLQASNWYSNQMHYTLLRWFYHLAFGNLIGSRPPLAPLIKLLFSINSIYALRSDTIVTMGAEKYEKWHAIKLNIKFVIYEFPKFEPVADHTIYAILWHWMSTKKKKQWALRHAISYYENHFIKNYKNGHRRAFTDDTTMRNARITHSKTKRRLFVWLKFMQM